MEDKKEHRNTLPKGFWLNEYEIESVLGKPGGFGITYLAMDTNLRQKVAVKEYLPTDFAIREGISTVYVRSSSDADSFQWGLKSFIEEARALARFSHPNIVRVLRFFEANGTAYMVMEYQEGQCFTDYLKTKRTLNEQELLAIIDPLLSGLAEIHKAGLLHRDIKPNNIYIRNDGTPVLLDFGSARYAIGQKSRSVTSIVTPGYAPLEQYDNAIKDQGPWSDIYALGAVMYHAIHGEPPPAATRRVLKDLMIPAVQIGQSKYNENLLKAIDWALQLSEEKRPQSVEQWRQVFLPESINHLLALPSPLSSPIEKFWSSPQLRWWCLTALSGVGVFLLVALWAIASLYYGSLPSQEIQAVLAKEQAARVALENQLKDTKALFEKEQKLRRQKELLLTKIARFEEVQNEGEASPQTNLRTSNYYDVVDVPAIDFLNVRSIPGALSPLAAKIPPNGKCVVYLGQFRIIGEYVWVLVRYKDVVRGWVNSQFLIENREEECKKNDVQPVIEEKKP